MIYDASLTTRRSTERLRWAPLIRGHSPTFIVGIRAASAQLNFELYLGTEDQLPDPTIESYEGVGTATCPAYRGLAYIVFHDFQLEKYGNRIPNFTL